MPRRFRLPPTILLLFALAACGPAVQGIAREQAGATPGASFAMVAPSPTPAVAPLRVALPTATPTSAPTPTAVPSSPPASCPVTLPPDPPFAAPPPYRPTLPPLYGPSFWYGTPALWTMLPADGVWRARSDKSFWWPLPADWRGTPALDLAVTGRRLDAPAPPMAARAVTHGFRDADDIGAFMLTSGASGTE